MPALTRLRMVFLAAACLAASAPLASQFASPPATVRLVAQLPPTVGVSWTLQGLDLQSLNLPQAEKATANVLVLRSYWVLAKGQDPKYECSLEGNPQEAAQLIALRKSGDPSLLAEHMSFLPPPATTRLSLVKSFLPQQGQHRQDDGVLILKEVSAGSAPATVRVTVVVL